MTRWHKADCATPDVVVDESQTPHCRCCNVVVEIDRIIADHVAHHVPVEIPPDEPVGQMALWWPPSVPYTPSHGSDVAKQQEDDISNLKPSEVTPLTQPSPRASPSAYETRLSVAEFRLARFDAPRDGADPDHPIHINLEVFRRDDSPEYETVSYTWGGEEDDSTLCRPVFVGPYWDVLLQTRNCWHMLRYLRPSRGIRLVWIDAICINQGDPTERALQVANMRSVYQRCSRVVIYLGADVVATPPALDIEARMHPSRHGLHEFDRVMASGLGGQGMAMTLSDLLTRRYFSRVWVIQEVLLSKAAVIPIAGREFWANGLTPIKYEGARKLENTPRLSEAWNWESTRVPWMRDLCCGSLHASTTLYDVLLRTWQSKATDPRDKFFGVLGLIDSQSLSSPVAALQEWNGSAPTLITPDYTISVRHAFTGIMAHALFNLGNAQVLVRASGLAAPPNHPSWLPDMSISKRQLAERDDLLVRRSEDATWWLPDTRSVVPLTYLSTQASWGNGRKFVTAGLDDPFNDSSHSETKLCGPWNQRQTSHPSLYDLHSWRAGATVDPSTGDLLLKVGHLLQFDSCPQRADHLPGISLDLDTAVIPYVIRVGSSSLFVSVPATGPYLDHFVTAGKNHLFYLEREDTRDGPPEFLLLFLREVEGPDMSSRHDSSRPKEFKLVLCCPYLDIFLMFRKPERPDSSAIENRTIHQVNVRHSLYATLVGVLGEIETVKSPDSPLRYFRLRKPPYGDTNSNGSIPETAVWEQIFPGSRWPFLPLDEILALGQIILSSERSGAQDAETAFAGVYLGYINSRFPRRELNPRLVNEMGADKLRVAWVEMSILAPVGETYWDRRRYRSQSERISWEWRYSPLSRAYQTEPKIELDFWQPFDYRKRLKRGKSVTIRARISDFVGFVKTTHLFKQMQRLHFMFRQPENSSDRPPVKVKTWAGEEDETDMILRGPQEGDHFLPERPYRPWPEEVVRDFKADGVYWNIRIS